MARSNWVAYTIEWGEKCYKFIKWGKRARYDIGHIWPPLKISSNVDFSSISHLLNKIKQMTILTE